MSTIPPLSHTPFSPVLHKEEILVGTCGVIGCLYALSLGKIHEALAIAATLGVAYWAKKLMYPSTQKTAALNQIAAVPSPKKLPLLQVQSKNLIEQKKQNFLRRIPKNKWEEILQMIRELERPASLEELNAFQKGVWTHPVFKNTTWHYAAFHAYLEGTLDEDTMCKLFLYRECQTYVEKLYPNNEDRDRAVISSILGPNHPKQSLANVRTYQLFDARGQKNSEAEAYLRASTTGYLNEDALERLMQELSQLPPEQSQFFVVPRTSFASIAPEPNAAIPSFNCEDILEYNDELFEAIVDVDGIAWPLFYFVENIVPCQMVASPQFLFKIHQAKAGSNAIQPIPALSFSSKEKLSDPIKRVASIPAFDLSPQTIHQQECDPLSLYHHDMAYHHAIESVNVHRSIWIAFAKFLKEQQDMSETIPLVLDRELTNYIKKRETTGAEDFWIGYAYLKYAIEKIGTSAEEALIFDTYFIEFYLEHVRQLKNDYGIDIHDLEQLLNFNHKARTVNQAISHKPLLQVKKGHVRFLEQLHEGINITAGEYHR